MTAVVEIYTDGAAEPNPGRGGYAVIIKEDGRERVLTGGYRRTTNNRMELLAVIAGLESLSSSTRVIVHSDSTYVVRGSSWCLRWQARGWQTKGKATPNRDLWERLLLLGTKHHVEYIWVRGHAGNRENERCDSLAINAAMIATDADVVYEASR